MKRSKTHLLFIRVITAVIVVLMMTSCAIQVTDDGEVEIKPLDSLPKNCRTLVLYSGYSTPVSPQDAHHDNYQLPPDMPDHRYTGYAVPPPPFPPTNFDRKYDEDGVDNSLVQTFDWRGTGFGPITCAILEFEAKPVGADSYNDNIQMYPWHFAENVIGVHPIAGAWLGTDVSRNIQGLQNPSWSQANFGNTLFTIDLENFPSDRYNRTHGGQRDPAYPYGLSRVPYFESINPSTINNPYQMEGGYDLTHMMSKLQHLDVFIGDDTAIDYMKLTLTSCDCEG